MKLGLGSGKSCTVGAWGIAGLVGLLLTQLQAYAAVPAGYTVQTVDIPVNEIVFDPVNSQLLASVPSRAGLGLGNTVSQIDPTSGSVVSSVFIGSEPTALGLSEDSKYLYVGMMGAPLVRRYDVFNHVAGPQFSLGSDSFLGPFYAESIAVQPGNDNVIAVARQNVGFSPRHEGVAIYDNGVARPVQTGPHTGSNSIVFGANGSTLYGYNNETTDFGFRRMTVDANGIVITDVTSGLIGGFGATIQYGGGLVFSSNGKVIDPSVPMLIGSYVSPTSFSYLTAIALDLAHGMVYGIDSGDELTIFDADTFVPIQTYSLEGVFGSAGQLVYLNDGELALSMADTGQLYLLRAVPEPAAYLTLLVGIALVAAFVRPRSRRADAAKQLP